MNSKTYFWFNCIWAGIITAMLFYAGFFAYSSHAVQCVYKDATGIDCATCGITRGFHHVLVGNFKTAYQLNPLSLQLFLFFAIQLIMRLCFMFLPSLRNNTSKSYTVGYNYNAVVICSLLLSFNNPTFQKLISFFFFKRL